MKRGGRSTTNDDDSYDRMVPYVPMIVSFGGGKCQQIEQETLVIDEGF